jgi:hypothetical protein
MHTEFWVKPLGKYPFQRLKRREDSIELDLRVIHSDDEKWMELAWDHVQQQTLLLASNL